VYDVTTAASSNEAKAAYAVDVGLECVKHVTMNVEWRGRVGKTWEELIKTVFEERGREPFWISQIL
jgi:hypothetical protein